MANDDDSKFGLQVSIGLIGNFLKAAVGFLGSILLARVLGPHDYGTFYFLMSVVLILDNPVSGLAAACKKRYREADFPSEEALGAVLVVAVGVLTIVGGSIILFAPVVSQFLDSPDAPLLLVLLLFGNVFFISLTEILRSAENFGASTWVVTGRDIIRVLGQSAFVLAGLGVTGMVFGLVAANLAVVPLILWLLHARPQLPSKDSLRSIWEYGRSSIPNAIVGTALGRMDLIFLGVLASSAAVGNYQIALNITLPGMFVASVAGSGLMGRVSSLHSQGKSYASDVSNNLRFASIIAFPLFFGALTVGREIVVTLYGSQYADAAIFLAGLALFRLIRTQDTILASTLNGLDRPDLNLKISTTIFFVNGIGGITLFYLVGPIGVMLATLIGEGIGYSIRLVLLKRIDPEIVLFTKAATLQLFSGLTMGAVIVATKQVWTPSGPLELFMLVGFGAALYFALLAGLSDSFRVTAREIANQAR